MIWNWHAPSHWTSIDIEGYEVHARCRAKKKPKDFLDKIKESWVIDLSTGETVKKFNNQSDIMLAMDKAIAYANLLWASKVYDERLKNVPDKYKEDFDTHKSDLVRRYCKKHGLNHRDVHVD